MIDHCRLKKALLGLVGLILLAFCVAAAGCGPEEQTETKASTQTREKSASGPEAVGEEEGPPPSEKGPPGPSLTAEEVDKFYERGLEEVRQKYARDLDAEPAPWRPSPPAGGARGETTRQERSGFREAAQGKQDQPLVRPLPYPYAAAATAANVVPEATYQDLYSQQLLLSRRYGLDLPLAFFPFNPELFSPRLALFGGGQTEPLLKPISLKDEEIDALPLFLTAYYRGWVGGISGWYRPSPEPVIVARHRLRVKDNGTATAELTLRPTPLESWAAFILKLSVPAGIQAFELVLTEANGLDHALVYQRPLGGRPGWDLSARSRSELRECRLSLAEEKNKKFLSVFGQGGNPEGVKRARLTVQGKPGAQFVLESLAVDNLDRERVAGQMALMRAYNVLPVVEHRPEPGLALAEPAPPAFLPAMTSDFGIRFRTAPADSAEASPSLKVVAQGKGVRFYQAALASVPAARNLPGRSEQLAAALGAESLKQGKPGPETDRLLGQWANRQYNLDGRCPPEERVWVVPPSVYLRFRQARAGLEGRVSRKGNRVQIRPWTDAVTGQPFPDPQYITQDLHGVTFYVPDSSAAQVFCGRTEITSLKRNPADSTGRQSVTIVDDSTRKSIFDEVDLTEMNGRIFSEGAAVYFQRRQAYRGDYALEVQAEGEEPGLVAWKPFRANSWETGFLRFAYKKTNPHSRVLIAWSRGDDPEFVATDGDLEGRQGWRIPHYADTKYHEVVLDFAEMAPPAEGSKVIPRVKIKTFFFGLLKAKAGDSVFFDQVDFLAARGVRPEAGQGVVIGGRLYPHSDGEVILLRVNGRTRKTTTTRGGWYLFPGVPRNAVFEITSRRGEIVYFPARGRVAQAVGNDLEFDLYATDPRSPSVPRPEYDMTYTAGTRETMHKVLRADNENTAAAAKVRNKYSSHYGPHHRRLFGGPTGRPLEFWADEQVNNFGWVDRDRRFDNPDQALRILLLGGCWQEGLQTTIHQHTNIFLESFLRRETGVNVEVILQATPDTTIGHNAAVYPQYGQKFKPDFVLTFVTQADMYFLEPSLYAKRLGMPVGHAHKNTYDFDEKGDPLLIPSDPDHAAFRTERDLSPLIEGVSQGHTGFVTNQWPPVMQRAVQLLKAVLHDVVLNEVQDHGGRLGVIYGYHANTAHVTYKDLPGPYGLARERWLYALKEVCYEVGAQPIDLSETMFQDEVIKWRSWENNWHPSPFGHYIIARSIADKLLNWPEFRAAVEKARAAQENP